MKKLTALFLAIVLAFSLLPVSAAAATKTTGGAFFEEHSISLETVRDDNGNYQNTFIYTNGTEDVGEIEGISYDKETNTLTLDNADYANSTLRLMMMGEDFTIRVNGSCSLSSIGAVDYGKTTNINITGTGTLTINENRFENAALWMFQGNETKNFNIDKDVTVHLYAGASPDEPEPGAPKPAIANAWYVRNPNADTVFTADGESLPNVEKIVYGDSSPLWTCTASLDEAYTSYEYVVIPKFESDGIYTANYWETTTDFYIISHYLYSEEYGAYIIDDTYVDDPSDPQSFGSSKAKTMTPAEFEENFEFAREERPQEVFFSNEENEKAKAYSGLELTCSNDPEGKYVYLYGSIFKLNEIATYPYYQVDPDTFPINGIDGEKELNELGFAFIYCNATQDETLEVWDAPIGTMYNTVFPYRRVYRADDEEIYVCLYDYSIKDEDGNIEEEGYCVAKVLCDEDTGDFYVDRTDKSTWAEVTKDKFEGEEPEYSFGIVEYVETKNIAYIPWQFSIENYGISGSLCEKDGKQFVLTSYWNRDHDTGVTTTFYQLFPVEYSTEHECLWQSGEMIDDYTSIEEIEAAGYTFVMEEANAQFNGYPVMVLNSYEVYADENGTQYAYDDFREIVYRFTDAEPIVRFGEEYRIVEEAPETDVEKLEQVMGEYQEYEYSYVVNGDEYHHIGSAQPARLIGDVNGDGAVTIDDATEIQKYLAQLITLDEASIKAADTNGDGDVTISDATQIQKYLAQLIDKLG